MVRAHLGMFGVGFVALGVSQLVSERRWMGLHSYGVVYDLLTHREWGMVFCAVGAVKLAAAWRYPQWALLGLTVGSALVAAWAVSFAISYFTDRAAPPTLAVTWTILLAGHAGVATMLTPRRGVGGRGG